MGATRGEAASDAVHFFVSGLTCADCAAQFEESIRELEGIKSAQLNFGAGRLVVRGIFHPREIMRHAKRAGYQATVVDSTGRLPYGPLARDVGPVWFLALAALFFVGGVVAAQIGLSWPDALAPYIPRALDLETVLFAASIFYGGFYPLRRALHGLFHRRLDAGFVAVTVAVGAMIIGEWLQAAAAIGLFSLRELLLSRSLEGARRSVRRAWRSLPDEAVRVSHGNEAAAGAAHDEADGEAEPVHDAAASHALAPEASDVAISSDSGESQSAGESVAAGPHVRPPGDQQEGTPIAQIAAGDVCLVGPGQRVPVDGVVVHGGAIVHEPPLAGAEMPGGKRTGDFVRAGSRVDEGEIRVRAQRPAAESELVRCLNCVEEAQGTPLLTLRWTARVSVLISSVAVLAALAAALAPPLVLGRSAAPWLEIGLGLLVLSFPCAFSATTPTVLASAISHFAGLGVLVKNGDALERLARVNVIAFEKDGAYTQTRLAVEEIYPLGGWNEQEVLALCAGLAWGVDDPVAAALVQAAIETEAGTVTVERSEAGDGGFVEGIIGGERYAVGPVDAMRGRGVALTPVLAMVAGLEKDGKVVALVAHGQEPIAVAALRETVIEESRRALLRLKRMRGIDTVVMLTGDDGPGVTAAAIELQADEYRAGLRPDEKAGAIKQYQRQGKKVAMIGRYEQDRPALAVADVGIAMGSLGEIDALEKADLLLVGENFSKLPHARALARRALAVGWQNAVLVLLIKVAALVLLGLGRLALWQTAVADFLMVAIVALGVPRISRRIRLPQTR